MSDWAIGKPAQALSGEEANQLRAEYRAWRVEAGLAPPAWVEARFRLWQRYLERQCGTMFAPWSLWEE